MTTLLNTYAVGDVNLTNIMAVLDQTRVGANHVSLTNMGNTTAPAIAAGSWLEVAGALYTSAGEAISTTDPITGTTVVDGTVYIVAIPNGSSLSFAFTATAPVWSDSKQGWYLTAAGKENYRVLDDILCIKSSAIYDKFAHSFKYDFCYGYQGQIIDFTTGVDAVVSFADSFDPFGVFDGAKFTAARAGRYRIDTIVKFTNYLCNSYSTKYLKLYRNGSLLFEVAQTETGDSLSAIVYSYMDFNYMLYMIPGDYIQIYANVTFSGSSSLKTMAATGTFFSVAPA